MSCALSLLAISSVPVARAEEDTYRARLVNQIAKFRQYPEAAAALAIAGTTVLRFRLDRDGKLLANEVKETSGDEDLDKAALETMERGQPFPTAPPEMSEGSLEFVVPIVFKYSPRSVTAVTGDLHLGAFMTGSCGSTTGGEELTCKYAAYYISRAGVSYFRMPLLDIRDPSRELWFAGSTVQITGASFQLAVERVILKSRGHTGFEEKSEPLAKPANGSCQQIGNFTRRRVSTISCSAKDDEGNTYTANFATDGTPVKVRRDTDERLFRPAN